MLSGIITIALLLLFVGGWIWAWRPARKAGFDAAARLALDEDEQAQGKGEPR
jgi:cytochrome c oxidase cbb3-type subunit IV